MTLKSFNCKLYLSKFGHGYVIDPSIAHDTLPKIIPGLKVSFLRVRDLNAFSYPIGLFSMTLF